ncbi:MAG: YCF48-related protein [Acidobacteriota bacterium]
MLRSEDGGSAWGKTPYAGTGRLEKISFIDSKRGWSINSKEKEEVLSSADSGTTWSVVTNREYFAGDLVGGIMQVEFVDEEHGWLAEPFAIWWTEDGGATWKPSEIPWDVEDLELIAELVFVDSETGWWYSQKKSVYRTTDGGKTWNGGKLKLPGEWIRDLFFIDRHVGWLCTGTRKGGIYSTRDGGVTWRRLRVPVENVSLASIFFVNGDEGWAVGEEVLDEAATGKEFEPLVLHTIDGGKEWERVSGGGEELGYDKIYFGDAQNGWLVGYNKVYRTDDGGNTWQTVLTLPDTREGQ